MHKNTSAKSMSIDAASVFGMARLESEWAFARQQMLGKPLTDTVGPSSTMERAPDLALQTATAESRLGRPKTQIRIVGPLIHGDASNRNSKRNASQRRSNSKRNNICIRKRLNFRRRERAGDIKFAHRHWACGENPLTINLSGTKAPRWIAIGTLAPVNHLVLLRDSFSSRMRLSIIIPVYNERQTIGRVLTAISRSMSEIDKEIIIVDDCSTDGTREWLKNNIGTTERMSSFIKIDEIGNVCLESRSGLAKIIIKVIYHPHNKGKGGCLQTALFLLTGDIVIIQDADLEYDPQDWEIMYDLIATKQVADVVYGSRFFGLPHRSLYFHHYLANRLLSLLFNLLYNQTLSDIEVCYKMFTRAVSDSLKITCNDFGCEIQLSAQICRQQKWRIYETPIRYYGRTYHEGKKIDWRDGVKAFWYLLKYRLAKF